MNNPDKLKIAREAFYELREAWFNANLAFKAHERQWETEEAQEDREQNNRSMKNQYDGDTEAILNGEVRVIAPSCWNDLRRY